VSTSITVVPFDGPIDATASIPGSKSITNRALVIAALANGVTTLDGALFAADTLAMVDCLAAIGVDIESDAQACQMVVAGNSGAPSVSEAVLDAGQSGTTSRFLLPVLAALPGAWTLDGHQQLRSRPFDDQLQALSALGARVESMSAAGRLPLRLLGGSMTGGQINIAGDVSSQFLSGLLLAAPLFDGELVVSVDGPLVSRPYVDMTVAVMRSFGAVVTEPTGADLVWSVVPSGYEACEYSIEPDASAASYAFGAAAVTRGRVVVAGLSSASLQGDTGFSGVLESMGAMVHDDGSSITVDCRDRELSGIDVDMSQISDTAQTLAVVAATASTTSRVRGIGFIRRKETDRIAAIVSELGKLGISAVEESDGFSVRPGPVSSGVVDTYDDHRMAMSLALLALVTPGIEIRDPDCVAKTFPAFWEFLESLRPRPLQILADPLRILAIDGPAGSGKSTISKAVAASLGVSHLDTGAMYRAVTFAVLERGIDPGDTSSVIQVTRDIHVEVGDRVVVDGVDATTAIRTPEVTAAVSAVAAIPTVRREVVRLQRELALAHDACVVEGRDIGTVVFADAPLKIYLTARVEERARRRLAEMEASGLTGSGSATLADIGADIERRDYADSNRADSPLRPADDAIIVDTSDRTIEELVADISNRALAAWAEPERREGERG